MTKYYPKPNSENLLMEDGATFPSTGADIDTHRKYYRRMIADGDLTKTRPKDKPARVAADTSPENEETS